MESKGILQDSKQATYQLINSLGSTTFNTLCALTTPADPHSKTYKELVKLLEDHLSPEPNIIVQQHRFLCRRQEENENVSKYVTELRHLASTCQLNCECKKNVANIFLRAQFIRGLSDSSIREKLLQSTENLTFEKISQVEKTEPATINRVSRHQSQNNNYYSSNNSRRFHTKNFNNNKVSNFDQNNSRQNFAAKKNLRQKIDFKSLGLDKTCLRCGRDNHLSNTCRISINKLSCSNCNKIGHVSKVCISSLLSKKNVRSCQEPPQKRFETNYLEDMVGINKISEIFSIPTTAASHFSHDFAKYYVNIQGKSQKFEVDSGAGFTLLPENEFLKLKLSNKLKSTSIQFRSYTQGIFKPKGYVIVNVRYNNVESNELLFIVPNEFWAILGRVWIRHLKIDLNEVDKNRYSNPLSNRLFIDIKHVSADSIIEEFVGIFEKRIGCIPKFKVSLKLHPNAKPTFTVCPAPLNR